MWVTIAEIIKEFLAAIPIVSKYFPPKSTEQSVEEDQAAADKKLQNEQNTGRPSW